MARGGFRPGAGRPKLTEAEKAARRAEREAAKAAPAVKRKAARKKAPARVVKAKVRPKTVPVKASAADQVPPDVVVDATNADMSPLDYMLKVMRSDADPIRRDRMAIAAAPFVHARKEPVGQGKRQAADDAAKTAADVFKPGRAPLRAVS